MDKDRAVQRLLGLVQYVLEKFTMNLARLTEPLRRVSGINSTFTWGGEQEAAFTAIKRELSNVTRLSYYSRTEATYVFADARQVMKVS